jgi:hypothetical protein
VKISKGFVKKIFFFAKIFKNFVKKFHIKPSNGYNGRVVIGFLNRPKMSKQPF